MPSAPLHGAKGKGESRPLASGTVAAEAGVKVRLARRGDERSIAALERAAWADLGASEDLVRSRMDLGHSALIAVSGGQIVAAACFVATAEEPGGLGEPGGGEEPGSGEEPSGGDEPFGREERFGAEEASSTEERFGTRSFPKTFVEFA